MKFITKTPFSDSFHTDYRLLKNAKLFKFQGKMDPGGRVCERRETRRFHQGRFSQFWAILLYKDLFVKISPIALRSDRQSEL